MEHEEFHKSWALAAILLAAVAIVLAPRAAAQNDGVIRGQILDCCRQAVAISAFRL